MTDIKEGDKKQRLLAILDQGIAMIHLDSRRPGVRVPSQLANEFHLRLNLSYRFDPPDLKVSDWGIRSTLSFSGTRFTVAVPWSALFAITSHTTQEFWIYPDALPEEMLKQAQDVPNLLGSSEEKKSPPVLRQIRGEKRAETGKEREEGGPKPRPSHLRLVK